MKKTLMSVVMASVLVSGSAFAGKGDSSTTIEFNGNVTNNTCQIAGESLDQKISLGDLSVQQVKDRSGGSTPFTITLRNCDADTANVSYMFQDMNGVGSKAYLENAATTGAAAENVGVEISTDQAGTDALDTEVPTTLDIQPANGEYNIGLYARMVETNTTAGAKAGLVQAKATVVIKATK